MKPNERGDYVVGRASFMAGKERCPKCGAALTMDQTIERVETFGDPTLKGVIVKCDNADFDELLHFADAYSG